MRKRSKVKHSPSLNFATSKRFSTHKIMKKIPFLFNKTDRREVFSHDSYRNFVRPAVHLHSRAPSSSPPLSFFFLLLPPLPHPPLSSLLGIPYTSLLRFALHIIRYSKHSNIIVLPLYFFFPIAIY